MTHGTGVARASRRFGSAACVLVVTAIAACSTPVPSRESPARRESQRLLGAAHRAFLALQQEAAQDSVRSALATDPSNLSALFNLYAVEVSDWSVRTIDALEAAGAAASDATLGSCYRLVAAMHRGVAWPAFPAAPLSPDAQLCINVMAPEHRRATPVSADKAPALVAARPDEFLSAYVAIGALQGARDWTGMARLTRAMIASGQNPLIRATAHAWLAAALHELGDDAAASAAERAARRDPGWLHLAFQRTWASAMTSHGHMVALSSRAAPLALTRHVDSVLTAVDEMLLAVGAQGDALARFAARLQVGVRRLDRGRIDDAVRDLRLAAALADSVGDPSYRALVLMRYGRALVKRGRHAEAERALRRAEQISDSIAYPQIGKEVAHNLLHLYESAGRWAEAAAAGDRFVRQAALGEINPVRMMSARDVGMFLRARGEIAASRPYFARMLADIDSLGFNWYYAGEYHELTGNPVLARELYERAVSAADEPSRALEGLVRVALAMGDTASARHWATVHDAQRTAVGRPESVPMLPQVVARTGTVQEARAAFDLARRHVSARGQIAGWAALTVNLAQVELVAGARARAAWLADSAAAAARSVGDAETALRAVATAARSRVGPGGAGRAAHADLRIAAVAAARSVGPLLRAEIATLLGDATAEVGRWTDALAVYAQAAAPLDSVARGIALDPAQAEFRSAQRRVYDKALALIVRNAGDARAPAALAQWSARRKGRAFGLGGRTPVRMGRPRPGAAIIDYVLLDSSVAALVVAAGRTHVVPLPAPAAAVRRAIIRMQAATSVRLGSRLDAGRARYPLDVAHELYRALVEPLVPLLGDATALTIVPDGLINLVPFDALATRLPAEGAGERDAAFLLDKFTISIAVTTTAATVPLPTVGRRVLVVAALDDDETRSEVAAIRTAAGVDRVAVLEGANASRRAVVESLPQASIVHIAAHAEANEHDPEASFIQLAGAGAGETTLRAGDVAALRLRGPLVVLSACETASGRVLDGEGVLSLSRSFLRAGAAATVATLWPVGGRSGQFSRALYASLAAGQAPAMAVRTAKLTMRRAGSGAFAWAPYQVVAGPAVTNSAPAR